MGRIGLLLTLIIGTLCCAAQGVVSALILGYSAGRLRELALVMAVMGLIATVIVTRFRGRRPRASVTVPIALVICLGMSGLVALGMGRDYLSVMAPAAITGVVIGIVAARGSPPRAPVIKGL
ncbi:MAG: hypothetical protein KDA32_08455 [Phycisphaerales bacterium]|nr:hypothetical protein [Phycisphaerales bacterium]